jgi:ribonuclease HI
MGSETPRVELWTDGGCSPNPGPGGWGAILVALDHVDPRTGRPRQLELSGFEATSTNQRMELVAAIEGLRRLRRETAVVIVTDSKYLINPFEQDWISAWQKRGWKNSKKQPTPNVDLWLALLEAKQPHTVTFRWVKGHASIPLNERCDELATIARRARRS